MQTEFTPVTDAQWSLISGCFSIFKPKKHCLRTIYNAIQWIVRTGCQWRMLESKYPQWQIVYYYFRKGAQLGLWEKINGILVANERKRQERSEHPSAYTTDSQSVKITSFTSEDKGIDGGKKVNGRKRHLMTDVLGLFVKVIVRPANEFDGRGGCVILEETEPQMTPNACIFVDHAYGGMFRKLATEKGFTIEIAAKPETVKGFVPVKKRWVVERTFGWFNFFRRLSKDYEKTVLSSEAMIYLAQSQILLNRIT
jgi:putative transposase